MEIICIKCSQRFYYQPAVRILMKADLRKTGYAPNNFQHCVLFWQGCSSALAKELHLFCTDPSIYDSTLCNNPGKSKCINIPLDYTCHLCKNPGKSKCINIPLDYICHLCNNAGKSKCINIPLDYTCHLSLLFVSTISDGGMHGDTGCGMFDGVDMFNGCR